MELSEYLQNVKETAEIEQKCYKRYDYKTPPYDLLKNYDPADSPQEGMSAAAAILQDVVSRILKTQAQVINVIYGPQVTRYELDIPTGTPLKSLQSHSGDIADALGVGGVRVEAPISGKRAVAIEVPNKNRVTVGLREVVSSPAFTEHKSPMLFSVGKDIGGDIVVCDLEKIPHILIAGQTGSEKSVGLNSLIVSLLYKSSPENLRFILIDTERTEFGKFRGMPHLLFEKIVTKPIEALNALAWTYEEMNRRYTVLQKYGCRNLAEYNSMPDVAGGNLSKLPHIVIVIGELAVLMQSMLSSEVENKICSIAALARAAGIHLIVATQHPTVNVVTGIIKVSMTNRIAYKVSQAVNSRIIIDGGGAEALMGDCDMLFYPYDAYVPKRIQGSFVGDEEVLAVVNYIKENYECDFDEQAEKFVSGDDGEPDPIVQRAIAYAIKIEQISTPVIQRRFSIGYARAARIMDYMEEQGFIGPAIASKPRRILITRQQFKDIYGQDVDEV